MENNLWTNVSNSSLVSAYQYDHKRKFLDVQFKSNGAKYRYFDITSLLFSEIENSDKPGTVIQTHIIKAKKRYQKLPY